MWRDVLRTVSRRWTKRTADLIEQDRRPTRFQLCGRAIAHGASGAQVRLGPNGASYSGVQTCGSVWVCPVCAAKVRQERARELDFAARRHVGMTPLIGPLRPGESREWAQQPGATVGGIEFVTATLRHSRADALTDTIDAVSKGFSWILGHRRWKDLRRRLPHSYVRSLEITITRESGWHPHLHFLLLTERPWTQNEREDAQGVFWALWLEWCKRLDATGRHRPSRKHGLVWETVNVGGVEWTARYLSKLTEGERQWGPAQELTRADAKSRRRSLQPFELGLAAAETGEAWYVARWLEYEDATHGRRMLTWSQDGVRDRLGLGEEVEDEQLAAAPDDDADVVGYLLLEDFRAVVRSGVLLPMLQAVEADGIRGFWRVLSYARSTERRRRARSPGPP